MGHFLYAYKDKRARGSMLKLELLIFFKLLTRPVMSEPGFAESSSPVSCIKYQVLTYQEATSGIEIG